MIVHHVEMDHVRAGSHYGLDFFPQPCKIGRENAWGDAIHATESGRRDRGIVPFSALLLVVD